MKTPTKVGNFPTKHRTLDHTYTPTETVVEDTRKQEVVDYTKDTLLRGVHLLEIINHFSKDTFIPVPEDKPEIRLAVSILDENTPDGDKITFQFYKQIVNALYAEIQNLTSIYTEDGKLSDITSISRSSKILSKKGIDPWLLKLIMSGSSSIFVYLLHKAMTPFIAQDIAESVNPVAINPVGLGVLQVTGLVASRGIESLNKALAKSGKKTVKTETTTKTLQDNDDPIQFCWHTLMSEADKIWILDYVSEYLKTNFSQEYAPWLLYEDVYARAIVMYNRFKQLKPNTTEISTVNTIVEKHFDDIDVNNFVDSINTHDYSYLFGVTEKDSQDFRKAFNKIAASLSDYHYIQNAICCVFKYLLNLSIKDVKKFRDFISLYKGTLKASSDFSNLRSIDAFTDGIREELKTIIEDLRTSITDSLINVDGSVNETIACFSVNNFVNIMLDFVDTLEADLSAFLEIVKNIYAGWELDLDRRIIFVENIKELDYFIGMLDYVISAMAKCEIENRDDPRAPYEINNYISNYINPKLKKFPRAEFSGEVEPTKNNSYQTGTKIKVNDKIYTINKEELSLIDKQTYVSCQDKASAFDSTLEI